MKYRESCLLMALSMLVLSVVIRAQGEGRTFIRPIPRPNQTVRFELIHDLQIDVTVRGVAQAGGTAPTSLVTKTVIAFTQKTGAQAEPGKIEAQVTYEKIFSERTMNGKPMPPDNLGITLVGKTATLTFDAEGRIADLRIPPDVQMEAETLKRMMSSFYGDLPSAPMAVGESAAMPFSMAMPIPVPGAGPLNATGEIKYTLVSLATEGTEPLARLDQTVQASLVKRVEIPRSQEMRKVDIGFKVSGTGELYVNLRRGVVKNNSLQLTMDGTMVMLKDSADQPTESLTMHGTSRIASSGTY